MRVPYGRICTVLQVPDAECNHEVREESVVLKRKGAAAEIKETRGAQLALRLLVLFCPSQPGREQSHQVDLLPNAKHTASKPSGWGTFPPSSSSSRSRSVKETFPHEHDLQNYGKDARPRATTTLASQLVRRREGWREKGRKGYSTELRPLAKIITLADS